jgi:hypothetical protein
VGLYLAIQVLVPLRHWLYPGDVYWTEEGHRFSWRMKLRDKESRLWLIVRDARTGQVWQAMPEAYLPPWQAGGMMGRPDMVLQFAHYVRDEFRRTHGVAQPEVYANLRCSLNGAPEQPLLDATVDLAAEKPGLRAKQWILPR